MCGIAGFTNCGCEEDICRMTAALAHRGPDDNGIFFSYPVALGHRRLSIIDIAGGVQPMHNPAAGLIMVYNGEIYNHLDLRIELEHLGHVFHTAHSDTETVLHAFAQWGVSCLIRFNGMFALAIYDTRQKLLWLARDRFGEKPLFYAHTANGFAFASEIGALKLWPGFNSASDEANFQRFFAWNYMPGGRTLHRDCKSLAPGSWLCLNLKTNKITSDIYWCFTLDPDHGLTDKMEPDLAEELQRLIVQSVKRRLLSDVPLGIFLSGGIDSSSILAAATQISDPASIQTFTIGFREKSFDESEKAISVARHFGVRHRLRYLTENEMLSSTSTIFSRMSEPFGDASLIPTAHLCRFARKYVTVALSGDGGDELFGGYDPMAAIAPAALYRKIVPEAAHKLVRYLIAKIPASDVNMSLEFKLKRVLRGLSWPDSMQLAVWMSGLDPAEIQAFFEKPLTAEALYADAISLHQLHAGQDGLAQALLFFTCIYLPDDILVKSDRASMLSSLETRAIFLDNDLVDFCRHLPMRFKYRNGRRKYLLKKALANWLPQKILNQPKKGFGIPLNLWLRDLPRPSVTVPGLKPGILDQCYAAHQKRVGDFRYFLWDLQSLAQLAA